jgi:Glycosyltransferase family 87/WD40-like Beta Propeller Repeat
MGSVFARFLWKTALLGIAAILAGRLFFGPFIEGWMTMRTDFPNHYVAAILALRHEPLRQFYDWEWFQRQIQYSGIDAQLGGYTPYTPLTMLPFLPLAKLPPQRAKQIWLALQIAFLGISILILSKLSNAGLLETLVLALLAYVSLATNLILGHYYIFLLFVFSAALFCLLRGRPWTGGALLGLIFALKLYAGPFLLYFAVRRQWRALWGMMASVAALALAAIAWFGPDAVWFYTTSVMTRGLDGSIVDPYNPGLGSMSVLLRRLFVPEPELNPHPLANAPTLFFFLQALYGLGGLMLALLALPRKPEDHAADQPALAWFILVLFALSPITAYSHFILLLAPVALLLRGAPRAWSAGLILLYVLVQLPTRSWNAWLFPKLWFSLALAIYVGWQFYGKLRARQLLVAFVATLLVSAAIGWRRLASYRTAPPLTAELVAPRPRALFSSAPVLGQGGPIYESIEERFFALRAPGHEFVLDGDMFHPSVPASGWPIYFELVSHGRSRIVSTDGRVVIEHELEPIEPVISPDGALVAFISRGSLFLSDRLLLRGDISNPAFFPDGQRIAFARGFPGRRQIYAMTLTAAPERTLQVLVEGGDNFEPAVSPDGNFLAFVHQETGARQVWVKSFASGASRRMTDGACNNDHPAWESDSHSIVFASDCSRGYGLPALYRIPAW